jgi:hypothetical protein
VFPPFLAVVSNFHNAHFPRNFSERLVADCNLTATFFAEFTACIGVRGSCSLLSAERFGHCVTSLRTAPDEW